MTIQHSEGPRSVAQARGKDQEHSHTRSHSERRWSKTPQARHERFVKERNHPHARLS